jgi:soluble lytic murein transglycosylase
VLAVLLSVTVGLATPAPAHAAPSKAAVVLGAAWTAFEAGDYEKSLKSAEALLKHKSLENRDYALYVAAQSAFWAGKPKRALPHFEALAKLPASRFAAAARWRIADCHFALGALDTAAAAYRKLLGSDGGDDGVARYRIGEAQLAAGKTAAALATWRELAALLPAHPLADRALLRMAELGAPPLTARERSGRASRLTGGRDWTLALGELAWISDDEPADILVLRDFWLGNTLFKMRRQYARAGELLLSVYDKVGPSLAAYALFHGARGLSRGDRDDDAIQWYAEVVRRYPDSEWAPEAQFLSGWLEYNRGDFRACIPGLEGLLSRYPRSKFAEDALWYLGYAHYLLGEYERALPILDKLAGHGGELGGGKGRYWHARTLVKLGRTDEANAELRKLPQAFPLTWYAILARAQLAAQGITVGPFGDSPGNPASARSFGKPDAKLLADPALAQVGELLDAELVDAAAFELTRAEKPLIQKYGAGRALPTLMDRYVRARNFNRPWVLAEGYDGGALRLPPEGDARPWWLHAYPAAYRAWVEKYQGLGASPPYSPSPSNTGGTFPCPLTQQS